MPIDAKATCPVDHDICSDASLAARDLRMSRLRAALIRSKPDQADALSQEQRAFIIAREGRSGPEWGKPPSSQALSDCVWDLTTARRDELEPHAVVAGLGKSLD